jgi:hypothetical protein
MNFKFLLYSKVQVYSKAQDFDVNLYISLKEFITLGFRSAYSFILEIRHIFIVDIY